MSNTQDNQPVVLSQQTLLYTVLNRMILDPIAMVDLAPTLDFMLLLPSTISVDKPLVKDDVFLAEPWIDHDDTASLSSHSSIELLPSLPPVTSPTNFLYNHEPLFDGIDEDQFIIKEETIDTDNKRKHTIKNESHQQKRRKKATCKRNTTICQQSVKDIKENCSKTMFQQLTEFGIDWCRYCGTTEGVNWRPGPWGKRTLCNKHGCDYKGYGLASRLPRLDLSKFSGEKIHERVRPVVQLFCTICHSPEEKKENRLIVCDGGCSRAYHQQCHLPAIEPCHTAYWFCNMSCKENRERNKVVVELPRKHTPLMHLLPSSKINKKIKS
ncbi:hypothetical protein G6F43_010641 [Rhizopus delemar]|nr:hypothetical protein G6F43_010641 [Rhizopus delemar]